jgi:hypothetical protein
MKHEDYWRNLPMQPPTLESVRSFVEKCLREQTGNPRTNYFLAAVSKETGEVIGEAILRIVSLRHGQAEIGWGVDGQYTGLGLGAEIGRAMLSFGFGLDLYRLYRSVTLKTLRRFASWQSLQCRRKASYAKMSRRVANGGLLRNGQSSAPSTNEARGVIPSLCETDSFWRFPMPRQS